MAMAMAMAMAISGLAGCAAPALTPERTGQLAYAALGPEMQMGEQLTLVWVTPPNPQPAGVQPMTAELAAVLAQAVREPVNLGVGGPDSPYTAQVLFQALQAAPPRLPRLRIAFVGQRAEAALLVPVMAAKGAVLHFEPMAE